MTMAITIYTILAVASGVSLWQRHQLTEARRKLADALHRSAELEKHCVKLLDQRNDARAALHMAVSREPMPRFGNGPRGLA